MERPKIAAINCEHCKTCAYDLEEGSETEGQPILNGGHPIPVTRPPCHDDDSVCPKGKPGLREFTKDMAEVYWHWRLCCAMDEHPDDKWAKRYRRILEGLQRSISARREERYLERHREERQRLRETIERRR
jgi:hypothetical protein